MRTQDESTLMKAEEAARLLGVSRAQVYNLAKRKEIPHKRLGRNVLFPRALLMRFVESDSPVYQWGRAARR